MSKRQRYRKRASQSVIAIKMDLDFDGFVFRKWGAEQRCKAGDWLVDNGGDIYTIDQDVFARTYRRISDGIYVKTTRIWAYVATSAGAVETKEGQSHYEAGDYVVSNNEDGSDEYCISADKFEEMYELDEVGS